MQKIFMFAKLRHHNCFSLNLFVLQWQEETSVYFTNRQDTLILVENVCLKRRLESFIIQLKTKDAETPG